jgi:hypothetical protein
MNSYKMLSVMDHNNCYIFLHVCLGENDQEVLLEVLYVYVFM